MARGRELMTKKQTGHYWRLKSGDYDGVDVMQGYLAIERVAELEAKLKKVHDWVIDEIDHGGFDIEFSDLMDIKELTRN